MGDALKAQLTQYSSDIKAQLDALEAALTLFLTDLSAPPGALGNFGIPLPISSVTPNSAAATLPKLAQFKAKVAQITTTFQNELPKMRSKIGKTR